MGKIVAIANQKGGVGKTTTAVNLAAAVAEAGKRVLIVDIDPQGNATSGLGIQKRDIQHSTYNLLIDGMAAGSIVRQTDFTGLDILPANLHLAGAELELVESQGRETRLKAGLLRIRDDYDFIFIDCPPSLGLITLNALTAANTLIVPIQCEYYALEGLSQLVATVRQVRRLYNPSLDIEGVLLTMVDMRLNLTAQVIEEVKRFFPQRVYSAAIPRNIRLSEAPSFGQPVNVYDPASKGAASYGDLAAEFLAQQAIGAEKR